MEDCEMKSAKTKDQEDSSSSDEDVDDESMSVVDGEDMSDDSLSESSSTDDGNDDKAKCPICLNKFRNNEVATPETCQHTFCFDCISEWSTNTNTCPIDRQSFRVILIKSHVDGPVIRKVPVKDKNYDSDQVEEDNEDRTFCEACGHANREERLLLCDGCDRGYHLECLDPPLNNVPIHEWFCPTCVLRNERRAERNIPAARRAIPRTRATERVRNRIANRIARVINALVDGEFISSTDDDDDDDVLYDVADENQPSTSTAVRPKPPQRRRRRRRRRRTIKRLISSKTGKAKKFKRRRRRRRRTTRKTRPTLRRTLSESNLFEFLNVKAGGAANSQTNNDVSIQNKTIKSRLASQLGIIPPKKEFMQPTIVRSRTAGESSVAGASTSSTLFLFGNDKELVGFDDEIDDDDERKDAVLSQNARKFNRPLSSKILKQRSPIVQLDRKMVAKTKSLVTERSTKPKEDDLLGSIFEGQNLLLGSSGKVVVRRDGSLEAKKVKIEEQLGSIKASLPVQVSSTSEYDKEKITNDDINFDSISNSRSVKTDFRKEEKEKATIFTIDNEKRQSKETVGDDYNRKISLDNRIEALAAAQKVTPRQLPYSVASQLGLRDGGHNIRRKLPLLPHPTVPTNESYAELMSKVLQSGPPPPPPPPSSSSVSVGASSSSIRQMPTLYSRAALRPNVDSLPMEPNLPLLLGPHSSSVRFSPAAATSNALFTNFNIPPPPPAVAQPPTSMNTYAAPAYLAGAHRSSLPARLPFPFVGQDLTQPKFVVPNAANDPFLVGPSNNQQLSAFRWTVPSTAIRLQTPNGPTVVHVPSYPQVSLPLFAQQASAGVQAFQARQNLLMNQYAAVVPPDFNPFTVHNVTEQSPHRVNSYGIDVQALTGSGLYMHHPMLHPMRNNDDDVPPAAPEVKTPVSVPMPPEEPTVPPPPSPSVKFDFKDPSIPQELLGLLAQFAQMKNEQNQRELVLAAKKNKLDSSTDSKSSFEPTPVKKPDIINAPNASPQILPMQISNDGDSPFSPASSSSGGAYSPEDNATQTCKPVRTVQFHPEVEDKNNERLSKKEKRQLKSEEKLKSLLRTTMAQNNAGSSNEDDVPSSAVDLTRRERLLAKFNYQLRVEEEVKIALKPYYSKRRITKEQYKNIMRKTVPKICKKKAEINPVKIHAFVDSYVQKIIGVSTTVGSKIRKGTNRKSEDDD